MAYIGKEPIVGNFQKCDALTASATADYTLQVSSVNVVPESANHMLVSLNGILQAPTTSFTVSGSTLSFASALTSSDSIDFVMLLGNVLDLGVPSDATVTNAKLAQDIISGETALASEPADTDEFLVSDAGTLKRIDYSLIKGGKVKQTVSTMVVSTTSGTTTFPVLDDTIPQNSEGNEFMTLAITPTSASTKLQIDVLVHCTNGTADVSMMTALFQDTTANALANSAISANNMGNNGYIPMNLTYVMTSGTTSSTTFKVRCGANSGTTYFNSRSGGREFGGVLTSSIVITEYE
jgi:hypothetical protein